MKNLKLLLSGALLAVSATALADDAVISYTAKVGTTADSWQTGLATGSYQDRVLYTGASMTTESGATVNPMQIYCTSGQQDNITDLPATLLYQNVTGLDNGTYHVTLFATAQNDWCSGFTTWDGYSTEYVDVYAKSGETTVKTPVNATAYGKASRGISTPGEYNLTVEVANGELELGLLLNQTKVLDFFSIQIKSLTREAGEAEALTAAIEAAKTALSDEQYANVIGTERSNLESAAITNVENSNAEMIQEALSAFVAAKDSYDAYTDAGFKVRDLQKYGYTDAEKWAFIFGIANTQPTTATEAKGLAEYMLSAYPAAVYSTAIAEACADRADYTSYITNPNATDGTNGWELVQKDGSATIGTLANEPATNLLVAESAASYFDGGAWGAADWTTDFRQTTSALPAGKYRLAVIARGETDLRWYRVRVNSTDANGESAATTGYEVNMPHIGSSNGDYGRGWCENILDFELTEAGPVQIDVQAATKTVHQWESFTYFRLTKLDPTVEVSELDLARAEAKALLANTDEYGSVWEHSEYVALDDLCDKADDEVTVDEIKDAIETFKAAKAGYDALSALWDAYAAYAKASDVCPNADADKVKAFQEAYDRDPDPAAEALAHTEVLSAAYREMIYSEAIAEGLDTRYDYTSEYLTNPAAEDAINGWTLKQNDGDSSIGTDSKQQPTNYPNADFTGHYFDGGKWGNSDWTTVFEQTTASVPAGTYRLSFIARGSTSLNWAYVKINDSVRKDFVLNGDQNGDYGTGWNQVYVDYTTGQTPETLKIDICASTKSQHQWHSFTDFKLVYLNSTTGIENVAVDAATDAPAVIYDLYGRRVANPGTGIYIVNGRKVVLRK
jgi:hypothetical protein